MAGPANVGKTSLIERFVQNVFVADPGPTLGCDCRQKAVAVGDTTVQLYLYDTAGQERSPARFGLDCCARVGRRPISKWNVAQLCSWHLPLRSGEAVLFVA